jgi:hypothetical protein
MNPASFVLAATVLLAIGILLLRCFLKEPTASAVGYFVLALIGAFVVWRFLNTGVVLTTRARNPRETQPFLYWFKTSWFAVLYCMALLGVWFG